MSPRIAGPVELQGKKAKKLGDCQWVIPGRIFSFISANTASKVSPSSGGWSGNCLRMSPGADWESTGNESTFL